MRIKCGFLCVCVCCFFELCFDWNEYSRRMFRFNSKNNRCIEKRATLLFDAPREFQCEMQLNITAENPMYGSSNWLLNY